MPITMIDTLSTSRAMPPMANSQPQPMERSISNMFLKEPKEVARSRIISSPATMTAMMLSVLMREAFPTAISGPPTMSTLKSG